jgi:hypothetical protein
MFAPLQLIAEKKRPSKKSLSITPLMSVKIRERKTDPPGEVIQFDIYAPAFAPYALFTPLHTIRRIQLESYGRSPADAVLLIILMPHGEIAILQSLRYHHNGDYFLQTPCQYPAAFDHVNGLFHVRRRIWIINSLFDKHLDKTFT